MIAAWWAGIATGADGPHDGVIVRDAHLAGTPSAARVDLAIHDGRFIAIGTASPDGRAPGVVAASPGDRELDLDGATIVPAFVDSHVHLSYWAVGPELADRGVAAAVDLGAPLQSLGARGTRGPRIVASGPMITAVRGYPLYGSDGSPSWGADGYGLPCADAAAARAAVLRLADAGAGVIKVPCEAPTLPDDAIRAAVDAAHGRGLVVVAHALTDAAASRAADLGIDGLAHTPTEPLTGATVAKWKAKFVIATLRAFGGAPATVDNLRRLRAAGATVLYGTDLGNTRDAGIDAEELRLLGEAGLDGAAILAAGTTTPARIWHLDDLGAIAVGRAASFLVLAADPTLDPSTLARPRAVWLDGRPR
ncbi:MAG: amidohydrolase family protein [Myxococcota bacterium]